MLYENWLLRASLDIKNPNCPPLRKDIETDFLVIGGGFAGLHAALRLVNSGKKVVLLEKGICGGSSSGQSGGFLTPETEEDMRKIIAKHGNKKAKIIYNIPLTGVKMIVGNVKKYKFNCDLRKQDSLYFSMKKSHNKNIEEEAETRKEEGLSFRLFTKGLLKRIHPGKNYLLGLNYSGSYGINSFAYCKEMKNLLLKKGVSIYEGTEVEKIEGNTAKTHLGNVTAKKIIVCIDKLKPDFHREMSKKYYHIQTYITISDPMTQKEIDSIFPAGELMCWDTSWNYRYYRIVYGNRLLLGGSSSWTTYVSKHHYSPSVVEPLVKDIKENFPGLKDVKFPYYWGGLIDVTKDLIPIVDYDNENRSIQYVLGCAGLNWAAYCGDYAARRAISLKTENLKDFLSVKREFFISDRLQGFLGKRISFMLSHLKKLLE